MNGKRYIVELASEAQLSKVPLEQLELATRVMDESGVYLLVYRDNFVAYKVASLTGGRVITGYAVSAQEIQAKGHKVPRLDNGLFLRLEPSLIGKARGAVSA